MFEKTFEKNLLDELETMKSTGTYKREIQITEPQGPKITLQNKKYINLCSNDYLGLANNKELIKAGTLAMKQYGLGMASVRFIAGTTDLHTRLESAVSSFLGSEDTILYSSCFEANTGFFDALFGEGDAIFSDELNHASIIDGIRLSKAERFRFTHSDMNSLEEKLKEGKNYRRKVIVTDGVFSMDGDIALLSSISKLAKKFDALLIVDDSHGTGVLGKSGRGSVEGMLKTGEIDLVSSTFGKALGGAGGGFISGKKVLVEFLRQRSRPYIFSNTVAPAIAGASLYAITHFDSLGNECRAQVLQRTEYFRSRILEAGFTLGGVKEHPITPILIGDEVKAVSFAEDLYSRGVYVRAFAYPVVPKGKARIRIQLSASHTEKMLDEAVKLIIESGKNIGIIS